MRLSVEDLLVWQALKPMLKSKVKTSRYFSFIVDTLMFKVKKGERKTKHALKTVIIAICFLIYSL